MKDLEPTITENGIVYYLRDDMYFPDIELLEETRPIGKWGRMHLEYLEQTNTLLVNHLILTGKLFTLLADLNEQANDRYRLIFRQMMEAEGVNESLKRKDQMGWVRAMNSIASRAEEIIRAELIYV